ncbi:hypothetical protein A3742_10600 [Oleiphilus sp. HI0071]|jgi:cytochrome c-type biogenesis protein CcmH|nr:hypothetical protein A3737_15415 [Oleiphilus sp. HI0065]KZY81895.1 hypothetical protein A3742_10600 [Oleiphilus sp. HI0071]KZY91667.1 hypothetical protein A3744_15000 [Oleiphilus sp. HI0073]KZZ18182.1 hypothetical protein A3751_09220 [Oleiphilus sp. HI0080]KZZ54698.1 hypothetical protein A3758_00130 [Oleiphilus sp. HI0118]KZZ61860.1 hypothetical protein A3760_00185 [Oleiphilus sp. HI0122]KZZ69564.1 hypothetical protein A3765_17295 [Oleiphilus sp. HI0130]KZZ78232.1 hypothetical protein A37
MVFACLLSLSFLTQSSSIDVFEFSSDENRQSYKELTRELRCPKCQNQDIADSNAPIAKDMRVQVHRLVEDGKTSDEVVNYMIERFGDFVTYKPKVSTETYLLWYGPWVFIVLGALVILLVSRRKKSPSEVEKTKQNSGSSRGNSVAELLEKYSDD